MKTGDFDSSNALRGSHFGGSGSPRCWKLGTTRSAEPEPRGLRRLHSVGRVLLIS